MKIKTDILKSLERLAHRSKDRERCGVLWYEAGDCVRQYTLYPGPTGESRFEFSDDWWLQQLYQARARGLRFAGLFHSHPARCSTFPSLLDRQDFTPFSPLISVGFFLLYPYPECRGGAVSLLCARAAGIGPASRAPSADGGLTRIMNHLEKVKSGS